MVQKTQDIMLEYCVFPLLSVFMSVQPFLSQRRREVQLENILDQVNSILDNFNSILDNFNSILDQLTSILDNINSILDQLNSILDMFLNFDTRPT